jgi:hypothetical protein
MNALKMPHFGGPWTCIVFEGGSYFRNSTLLQFVAENPVRYGTLPQNMVQLTQAIIDAGVEQSALDRALMLVATGSVPRICRVQLPLIDLLCDRGPMPTAPSRQLPCTASGKRSRH